jgi:uncharacterized protein YabN with tetrapyrrole methylase and pyrophosphatase domain
VNLAEEMGDLFWYIAVICDALEVSFEDVMERNIAKLKARYGDKFTEHAATNRNLEEERRILETTHAEFTAEREKALIQSDKGGLRNPDVQVPG